MAGRRLVESVPGPLAAFAVGYDRWLTAQGLCLGRFAIGSGCCRISASGSSVRGYRPVSLIVVVRRSMWRGAGRPVV